MEILQFDFMRNALLGGMLAAVACGVIGSYVVTKRLVFISGGIAHASFGGIGLGYLAGINPVVGAMFFALAAALGMGFVTRKTRLPEDTAIGIMWALGMALGIVFIGLGPGYAPDLFSYLFGNILAVPLSDVWLMLGLDAVIMGVVALFYREFLIISFDEEYGHVLGVPVDALYLLLLGLIGLSVVILIRIVGIILIIALLTIPATLARKYTNSLWRMMLLAIAFGVVMALGGLWLSYWLNLSSGASIIFMGVGLLVLAYLVEYLKNHLFKPASR